MNRLISFGLCGPAAQAAHVQDDPLPGSATRAYSVYVDERNQVWLTDFAANAIEERFQSFPCDRANANLRQPIGWWSILTESCRRGANAVIFQQLRSTACKETACPAPA